MIIGNILKFGFGDISCGCDLEIVKYQQFKPKQKCGTYLDLDKAEFIGEEIKIDITYNEYKEMLKLLDKVKNREIDTFEFKGYVFDFSNYNPESIRVVQSKLNTCMSLYILSLAA